MHSASRFLVGTHGGTWFGSRSSIEGDSRVSASTNEPIAAYSALSTGSTLPSRANSASNFTQSKATPRRVARG
ncbi:hypothetical protein ACR6C2_08465 [Streptomyces sp. INA 01156]